MPGKQPCISAIAYWSVVDVLQTAPESVISIDDRQRIKITIWIFFKQVTALLSDSVAIVLPLSQLQSAALENDSGV